MIDLEKFRQDGLSVDLYSFRQKNSYNGGGFFPAGEKVCWVENQIGYWKPNWWKKEFELDLKCRWTKETFKNWKEVKK